MVNSAVVKEIVRSYELSPSLEEKITTIALERVKELSFTSFESQYNYIARLIDRFNLRHTQLKLRDNGLVFLDKIEKKKFENVGSDSYSPTTLIERFEEEDLIVEMPIMEAVDMLENNLENVSLDLLKNYLGNNLKEGFKIAISPTQIIKRAPEILNGVKELLEKFTKDNQLYFPLRAVKKVSFSPLEIEYHTISKLSKKQSKKLVSMYDVCEGNASEASRLSGFALKTVINHWEKEGKKAIGRTVNNSFSNEEVNKILSLYACNEYSAMQISTKTGHDKEAVSGVLKDHGYQVVSGGKLLPTKDIMGIISARGNYKRNVTRAAQGLGFSVKTIRKYWQALEVTENVVDDCSIENVKNVALIIFSYNKFVQKNDLSLDNVYDDCSQRGLIVEKNLVIRVIEYKEK